MKTPTPVLDPLANLISDLVTFEEAAAALGVSRRTVELAIERGDLRAIRLGVRCVKLQRSDVVAYLKRRKAMN